MRNHQQLAGRMIGHDAGNEPGGVIFGHEGGALFAILVHRPQMRETADPGKSDELMTL
jgi:hypothetical protein